MDVSERFEQLIAYLHSNLPTPVQQQADGDGAIVFTGGEPGQVVARLTDTSVVISEYAVDWETPFNFVVRPRRVGLLKWRRLPETELLNALGQLIKGAREMRLRRFAICHRCDTTNPPEWMETDEVCIRCAGSPMGLVH